MFTLETVLLSLVLAATAEADSPDVAQVREAIQVSIPYIEREGLRWIEEKDCVSCHRVGTKVWSLAAEARLSEAGAQQYRLRGLLGLVYRDWVLPSDGADVTSLVFAALTFSVLVAVWAALMIRLGFLALVAALYATWLLDEFPITADPTAWYAGNSLFAMIAVLVVGLYGFYTSCLTTSQTVFTAR